MRVTIIKADNMVYIDGEALSVDCSSLPGEFHALQGDGDRWELETNVDGCHRNELIKDISPYQPIIDRWHAAKAAAVAQTIRPAQPGAVSVLAGN